MKEKLEKCILELTKNRPDYEKYKNHQMDLLDECGMVLSLIDVKIYKKKSEQSVRILVANLLRKAIDDGVIKKPNVCEKCKCIGRSSDCKGAILAHHEDYTKPLEIVWLCSRCHANRHAKIKENKIVAQKECSDWLNITAADFGYATEGEKKENSPTT